MSIQNMLNFSKLIDEINKAGRNGWATRLSRIKKEYQLEFEELRGTINSWRGARNTVTVDKPAPLTKVEAKKEWFKRTFIKR